MSKATILIVDDEPVVLTVINQALADFYQVRAANSGERALKIAATQPIPDLILLDVLMPEMDGYDVLIRLKNDPITKHIPVIFVTAMEAELDEAKGLGLGAVDYITKPLSISILLARVKTHLALKKARDFLDDKNTFLEAEVARRMEENQIVQDVSIRALAHLAEIRDPETGEHILRTQAYVEVLAKELQKHDRFGGTVTAHFAQLLVKSAPLHDIGKVGIPDHILLKPGKLNSDEWQIMKTHAVLGAEAIERAESDVSHPVAFLSLAKEVAHWHHERWNGEGYPDGLKGDAIPVSARLMAIADVFDALISQRVYKLPIPFSEAKDIIISERGRHFDPEVVDAFLACFDQFVEIAIRYQTDH